MADRHPAPPPRRPGVRTPADEPMIDLIFPNRPPPRVRRFEPSTAHVERMNGFGPQERIAFAHRKVSRVGRLLGRGRTPITRAVPRGIDRPVRRRRVLLGIGTGAVVAGGAGGAAALLTGAIGPALGGPGRRRPDTANEGLGAAGLADSPAEAARIAAAATPTWPTPLSRDPELHLLRRATFGPTLVDVVAIKQMGIDAWLERQLAPQAIPDPGGEQILATYRTVGMTAAQIRASVKDDQWQAMWELGHATLARQMWSSRQLFEVMVDFWANHLNITNPFDGGWDVRSPYDRDVIRKHALGRYSDMLAASARSPAMMRYLDNANSHRRSVNENYGRELLELHTVGIEAKYTEKDVRHSAYIMTGRTVDDAGNFRYESYRHWTGKVKVLGFTHPNSKASKGLAVGDAYVTYLATHPATARRVAHKLARRFVCDDPPQTLVDRLAQSYLDNGTAIVPMLRTLFRSVEFWMSNGLKTRRPLENVVATARILGVAPGAKTRDGLEGLYWMTNQLGHAPLNWGPPDGFPDVADAWGSAHATLGTWNAHRALLQGWHQGIKYPDPEDFVGLKPATVGAYLDTLTQRLVHQPLRPAHKKAMLKFLSAKETTKVRDSRLGGRIEHLVPLILDSVYHALR
jgi:uncharacterized protein (DUF1800 family)